MLVEPPGRRRRLLLVEGAPGYEHTFLKRALAHDTSLDVDSVIRKGQTDDGHPTFFVQAAASRAAALAAGLSRSARRALRLRRGGLRQRRGRLLHARSSSRTPRRSCRPAAGACWCSAAARSSARAWPARRSTKCCRSTCRIAASRWRAPRTTRRRAAPPAQLTADGADHPATRIGASPDEAAPALGGAAAAGLHAPSWAGRGRARWCWRRRRRRGDTRPLVAVQRYGQGRAMVFAGEASWRWRMMLPAADTHLRHDLAADDALARARPLDAVSVAPLGSPSPGTDRSGVGAGARPRLRPGARRRGAGARDAAGRRRAARHGRAHRCRRRPLRGQRPVRRRRRLPRRAPTPAAAARRLGASERAILAGRRRSRDGRPAAERSRCCSGWRRQTGGLTCGRPTWRRIPPRLQSARAVDGPPEFRDLWHGAWSLLAVIALLAAEWSMRRRVGLA